ncbi:MAG: hypothetical protein HY268_13875 [Deltaproteobacteria bacterium]|nr:hypothetical protein [Deltaproteobacteria bacterium]
MAIAAEASTSTDSSPYIKKGHKGEAVIGVVSTEPGVLLNDVPSTGSGQAATSSAPVALSGRVPVTVNLDGGEIKPGDPLTLSHTPGVATKATSSGMTIGYALQPFTSHQPALAGSHPEQANGTGKILIFINLGYARLDPAVQSGRVNTNEGWVIDQASGRITTALTLDMSGRDIINVRSILSQTGMWSIDENGRLVMEELEVRGKAKFGTPQHPQGITIFDQVTGEPGCVQLVNGALNVTPGECSSTSGNARSSASSPSSNETQSQEASSHSSDSTSTPAESPQEEPGTNPASKPQSQSAAESTPESSPVSDPSSSGSTPPAVNPEQSASSQPVEASSPLSSESPAPSESSLTAPSAEPNSPTSSTSERLTSTPDAPSVTAAPASGSSAN